MGGGGEGISADVKNEQSKTKLAEAMLAVYASGEETFPNKLAALLC